MSALTCGNCGRDTFLRFGPYEAPDDPGLRYVLTCSGCGEQLRAYQTSDAWRASRAPQGDSGEARRRALAAVMPATDAARTAVIEAVRELLSTIEHPEVPLPPTLAKLSRVYGRLDEQTRLDAAVAGLEPASYDVVETEEVVAEAGRLVQVGPARRFRSLHTTAREAAGGGCEACEAQPFDARTGDVVIRSSHYLDVGAERVDNRAISWCPQCGALSWPMPAAVAS